MPKTKSPHSGLTRRGFLKATAAVTGASVLAGSAATLVGCSTAAEAESLSSTGEEQIFSTICRSNCFQACLLNAHVRDGKVVKMSRGDYPEEIYSGCCLRGLSIPERTYSDNRIKYPLKRAEGTSRGAGEWERISWDQALEEIAAKIKGIQEEYGSDAVSFGTASGNYGRIQGSALARFINVVGGTVPQLMSDFTMGWGTNRVMGGGTFGYSNEPKSMIDARHIIIWGTNPVWSTPQTWRIILAAKDRGARLYCIDPIRSATSRYCDEYIQTNAGTDLYVVLALLNEVVSNDRIDADYAVRCTTAPFLIREDTGLFLRRSDREGGEMAEVRDAVTLNTPESGKADPAYVIDAASGQPALYTECDAPVLEGEFEIDGVKVKTAYRALKEHVAQYTIVEASNLSGIPEDTLRELAAIYSCGEAVTTYTQFGIDHYRGGHLWGQALAILSALTNNLSRPGTGIGGPGAPNGSLIPIGCNPAVLAGLNPVKLDAVNKQLCLSAWIEAVKTGTFKGEPCTIKAFISSIGNPFSNNAQQRMWVEDAVENLDLIVTLELEMTDTARYSDYVLPVSYWLEHTDVRGNFSNPYIAYQEKAIDPLWESKTDNEIFSLLAEKMGLGDVFPHLTEEEWVDVLFDSDAMREKGITKQRIQREKAVRSFGTEKEPWIIGGYGQEFPTPSGRAEIYCEIPLARYDFGQDWQSEAKEQQFPVWLPPYENWPGSEAKKKYPLSYLQLHERWRTHSQWFGCATFREIDREPLCHISREDALERGIADGDIVEVFNDRGHCVIRGIIDESLPSGVCYIPKGWQRYQFIEGGFQELTSNAVDACSGGYAFYDATVDVKKWED